jgi:hypothetical protein
MYRPCASVFLLICSYIPDHYRFNARQSSYPILKMSLSLCENKGRTVGKPSEYTVDLPKCVPIL